MNWRIPLSSYSQPLPFTRSWLSSMPTTIETLRLTSREAGPADFSNDTDFFISKPLGAWPRLRIFEVLNWEFGVVSNWRWRLTKTSSYENPNYQHLEQASRSLDSGEHMRGTNFGSKTKPAPTKPARVSFPDRSRGSSTQGASLLWFGHVQGATSRAETTAESAATWPFQPNDAMNRPSAISTGGYGRQGNHSRSWVDPCLERFQIKSMLNI